LIFLLSDFRGFDDSAAAGLARLAQHTDTALIALYDPLESAFPALNGPAAIADGLRHLRLAGVSAAQRQNYAEQFANRLMPVQKLARERRMRFASVDTQADPVAALIRMLGGR
jgi:uncharacterized protein (DUF58 family)